VNCTRFKERKVQKNLKYLVFFVFAIILISFLEGFKLILSPEISVLRNNKVNYKIGNCLTSDLNVLKDRHLALFTNDDTIKIGGYIYASLKKIDKCRVYLFRYNNELDRFEIVDTTEVNKNRGFYLFRNCTSGKYLIKALPDSRSVYFNCYFPTYYGNELLWSKSEPIQLNESRYFYNIHLKKVRKISGINCIKGVVLKNNKPQNNIQVILFDADNVPVKYDVSHQNGVYGFNNIPYGSYKLYVDLPGENTFAGNVMPDPNHNTTQNVCIELASKSRLFEINRNNLMITKTVFPNPCFDHTAVAPYLTVPSMLQIDLFDLKGKIVNTQNKQIDCNQDKTEVDLGFLDNGSYILRLMLNYEEIAVYRVFKN
jgi:hypothetical protein